MFFFQTNLVYTEDNFRNNTWEFFKHFGRNASNFNELWCQTAGCAGLFLGSVLWLLICNEKTFKLNFEIDDYSKIHSSMRKNYMQEWYK